MPVLTVYCMGMIWLRISLLLSLSLALSSCGTITPPSRSGTDTPEVAVSNHWSDAGGELISAYSWWSQFGSDDLNTWVEACLLQNRDALAALTRLEQASAFLRMQGAGLYPNLNARAGINESWQEGSDQPGRDGLLDQFTLGLGLTWDLDLWRQVRSAQASAAYSLEASREDLAGIALLVSSRAAELWLTVEENRGLLGLLNKQVTTSESLLDALEQRQESGQANLLDILQQRQTLASVKSEIPPVQAALQRAANQLRLLAGQTPNTVVPESASETGLPGLPPMPALGTPELLLLNRPDLRQARMQLLGAQEDVVTELADRYPSFSLGLDASTTVQDFSDPEDSYGVTARGDVTAPLFDGGQRRASIDRQQAIARERAIEFGTTFLSAINDVEDAVRTERRQLELLDQLRQQTELAGRVVDESTGRYQNGVGPFLNVFTATDAQQRLERRLLRENANLLRTRVKLYEAVGGGWTQELVPR